MNIIFEVIDKSGRKIRLTKEQWSKIRKKHPEVENEELIKEALEKPTKIIYHNYDESVYKYYKHYKNRSYPENFLMVLVKYLNGDGFIVTSYFMDKIE
ncbi:MAG: hypothetical protein Q7S74_02385 [Nanoarchaeota archaeon]|nr:hypothetical protein [Nanoarchaeota archaeon]